MIGLVRKDKINKHHPVLHALKRGIIFHVDKSKRKYGHVVREKTGCSAFSPALYTLVVKVL